MSNKDWTNKLRDQLADYQEPVSSDLWAGIEQSLAQKTLHQEVSRPAKIIHINTWKRWSAAAAAVALLGVGGTYVYFHQEKDTTVNSQLAISTEKTSASVVAKDLQPAEKTSENAIDNTTVSIHSKAVLAKNNSLRSVGGVIEGKQHLPAQANQASLASENDVMATSENDLMATSENNFKATSENDLMVASVESQPVSTTEKEKSIDNLFGNTVVADSYHFSHHEETAGWSMKLYAENLSPNLGLSTSGDSFMGTSSGVMADPMPGVVPDPTIEGGISDIDYLMASYKVIPRTSKGEAKHHAPVSVGLQVAFGIAPRLSLSTGFVYTRTSSDFYPYAPHNNYNVHQVLHYVGIPVGLNYELWKSGGFHAYVMAGAEADYNVKNDTEEEGVKKENAKRDRVQLSGKASLGAQYDITPHVGLYIEPGAKYYFDNGSEIDNTFKDKKLNFNFQFGLRFNL